MENNYNIYEPPKKKKNGWIIGIFIVLIILGILFVPGIIKMMKDSKTDVVFIESLKFLQEPNKTTVDYCNSLYNNSKPQTYMNQMYDCIGSKYVEKVSVNISLSNITREFLENQCDCSKMKGEICNIYNCGGQAVRI